MRELFTFSIFPYTRTVLHNNRMWRGVLRPKTGSGFVAYTRGYAGRGTTQTFISSLDSTVEYPGWYYRDPKNLFRFYGPFHNRHAAMIAFLLHTD